MIENIVKQLDPLPPKSKLIIFGGGYSGQHIAKVCRHLGIEVLCSRRTQDSPGADFIFDSKKKFNQQILEGATHVLNCIPPLQSGEDPLLNQIKEKLLQSSELKWVGYLSTTGVYGDKKGGWVNEKTIPNPQQERSIRRLSCEQQWEESGLPLQILRLPGIYGPGRSVFDNLMNGTIKMIDKPKQVFSRIHVDDIAGAVIHLINLYDQGNKPKIVNIADNNPTNNLEVITFAAQLAKKTLPSSMPFHIAEKSMSPLALSFWQENRRVDNNLLCKQLGYSLIHPDFKSGLKNCLSKRKIN